MKCKYLVLGDMLIDRDRIAFAKKCGENASIVCLDMSDGLHMYTVQVEYSVVIKILQDE